MVLDRVREAGSITKAWHWCRRTSTGAVRPRVVGYPSKVPTSVKDGPTSGDLFGPRRLWGEAKRLREDKEVLCKISILLMDVCRRLGAVG